MMIRSEKPLVLVMAFFLSFPAVAFTADSRLPVALMAEKSYKIKVDVANTVRRSLRQTQLLAREEELARALKAGDPIPLVDLANLYILNSPGLDVIAMFNDKGDIVAVNTQDASGNLIPKKRIEEILAKKYSGRAIIANCLTEKAQGSLVEFQTNCDFTPALFDSSGLSVAMSAPVLDPLTGVKIGVLSARLNFQRILDLIRRQRFGAGDIDVFLVSDSGAYFSEDINSGKARPPVEPERIRKLIRSFKEKTIQNLFAEEKGYYLSLTPLSLSETIKSGNLYIMLKASKKAAGS